MKSAELERVRNSILILAACMACVVAMALLVTGKVPSFSVVFLVLGFVFMAAHWGLLASLIDSFAGGEKSLMALWGVFMPFPLLLALAVVYVACRIDIHMVLPSAAGVLSVPVAGVFYGLFNGLIGCLRAAGEKGLAS